MNDTRMTFLRYTRPAPVFCKLAMERTHLSYERTLMAWIRTSLSMITFGFTLGKLAQMLQKCSSQREYLLSLFHGEEYQRPCVPSCGPRDGGTSGRLLPILVAFAVTEPPGFPESF